MLLNFKKMTMIITSISMIGGVAFSVYAVNRTKNIETQAAVVETKRVWASHKDVSSWWFNDGAKSMVETKVNNTYQSIEMIADPNNVSESHILYYADIPTNITNVQWYRLVGEAKYNFTGFASYGTGLFYIRSPGTSYNGSYSFSTTKIVTDFAATIDTSAEACSTSAAQDAVDAYNLLSTYEQNQFDALDVGGGKTGIERLNYLRTFYNISTPLNVESAPINDYLSKNLLSMIVMSMLTIISFASLIYFKKSI